MSKKHDNRFLCQWIRPDRDGQCPVLLPSQCCKDTIAGLWHFCTPDGGRFAICLPESGGNVLLDKEGRIELGEMVPRYASEGRGAYTNQWTVKAGVWKKIG